MKLYKEVFTGTFNYGLSKFLPQLIGFLLIPLFTHILSPSDYGLLDLCTAVAGFCMIFMRLGITGSIFRFYYDHKKNHALLRDYVSTMHKLIIATSLGVGSLFIVIGYFFISHVITGLTFWPFFVLIVATVILNTNSEIQKRIIQAKKQSGYMLKLNVTIALISILLVVLLVAVIRLGVSGYLLAGFIVSIIFFFQAQKYLKPYLTGAFNSGMAKQGLTYGLKVLPSHIISPATQLVSRVFLGNISSLYSVGIFSLANRFLMPLLMVSSAFQTAYNPIYFEYRAEPTERTRSQLDKITGITMIASLFIYVFVSIFGDVFVVFFTPERYHEAAAYIPWVCISFLIGILNLFLSAELYYSKVNFITVISIGRLVINLLLTYVLIYVFEFGVLGLIITILGENMINLLLTFLFVRREIPLRFSFWKNILVMVVTIFFVVNGPEFLGLFCSNNIVNLMIVFLATCIVIMLFNAKVTKGILLSLKRKINA